MANERKKEKLVIIGGGPAGLSAAIYAARSGIEPLIINGPEPGGQITSTSELENYPGFPDGIGGFDITQKMTEQADKFGARMVFESVEEVDLKQSPFYLKTEMAEYEANTVIIATGASPGKLGLEKEDKLVGSGISYCATCDGAFFKDKEIAVVGGGDVALEEANYLTKFGSKVYIIHRRDQFRGTKLLGDRVINNDKIEVLWDTELEKIFGEDSLEGLLVKNNETGEERELSEVRGFFIAVGYNPNTALFKDYLELNESGYIVTDGRQKTNIEGVFAAGDVQDPIYRQVVTSAASGAKAAIEADNYLEGLKD